MHYNKVLIKFAQVIKVLPWPLQLFSPGKKYYQNASNLRINTDKILGWRLCRNVLKILFKIDTFPLILPSFFLHLKLIIFKQAFS